MKNKLITAALMAAVAMPVAAVPEVALAQTSYKAKKSTHHYRKRHTYRCKKSKGTTGLIAGGVGGGLLANALGAGTVGTIAGAAGGALLGKHLDKKHDAAQNRRNGC